MGVGTFHKFCKMGGGSNKMTQWEELLESRIWELQHNCAHLLYFLYICLYIYFLLFIIYCLPAYLVDCIFLKFKSLIWECDNKIRGSCF